MRYSIAVGDFNGDADPDLAVGVSGVSVLLGGPGVSFSGPARYALPAQGGTSLALGDFNGDADPDIAGAGGGYTDDKVSVLLGGAGGSFSAAMNFCVGNSGSSSVGVGDFDRDARPDLALSNGGPDGALVSVLLYGGTPRRGCSSSAPSTSPSPRLRPVLGRTVKVQPLSGQVFVSRPGGSDRRGTSVPGLKGRPFTRLTGARQRSDGGRSVGRAECIGPGGPLPKATHWRVAPSGGCADRARRSGLVALEAAAAGLPVVASSRGGVAEVVRDGETGRLVAPGDHAALSVALRALADDPAAGARMGRAGQSHVSERFGLARMLDELQAVYHRLSAAPPQ